MASTPKTYLLAVILLFSVTSTSSVDLDTSLSTLSGAGLLSVCKPCRYDAQCTSCKCIGHRCVPENDLTYKCNRPNCYKCKLDASCASKRCIKGLCLPNPSAYYNCPKTRPYCYPCTKDSTCITGNCVKGDKCAFEVKDYYAKCPKTRPECAECRNSNQCKRGLECYRNKCVASKSKYYYCPGTRNKCDKCMKKSYLCAGNRKCLSGVCARDQDEVNECIKCCFYDKCKRQKICVNKNGFHFDGCKNRYYKYDYSCGRTIHKCCFYDACSGKRKCIKPNGLFDDTCGAQYKVTRQCKLIQTRKEHLCCYSDKCFITGTNVQKKCVKKGGSIKDTCGGKYTVGIDCSLKRDVCCYKMKCANQTICRKVGTTIHPSCGSSFMVMRDCKIRTVGHSLLMDWFSRKNVGDDESSKPRLIPIEERMELLKTQ